MTQTGREAKDDRPNSCWADSSEPFSPRSFPTPRSLNFLMTSDSLDFNMRNPENGGDLARRDFLRTASIVVGGASAFLPRSAHALLRCSPFDRLGVQMCEAGIDSRIASVTAAAVGGQHLTQWCWAACIEMVFRYYGYRVPQRRIVKETWGSIVNLPGRTDQILSNLNRPWRDLKGRSFSVVSDVFSANPMTAAQDLASDRPLIIGTMGHAMVLTSLTYVRDGMGRGQVRSAVVRDPWPGRGRRNLSAQEWYSTAFLARIRVR